MLAFIQKHRWYCALFLSILAYILYFSLLTIARYKTLYASYFDLGIMHQTVYNSYKAISTFDWGRLLELTNPSGPEQIKRMAIHNDILLAVVSLLYFVHVGVETLLVLQTVVLAFGALVIFKLSMVVLKKYKHVEFLSLSFSLAYLFYTSMERANIFDFHAVTLSTTLLLCVFYFWLIKKFAWSFVFFVLSLIAKEEVSLTLAFFGAYCLLLYMREYKGKVTLRGLFFPLTIIFVSIGWFLLSILVIIPHFHGRYPFAIDYYGDFGDSPFRIIVGLLNHPANLLKYLYRWDTLGYFVYLLGPVGFLSLLSPIHLAIAAPEFAINLLSNNWNMRNIIYHYTSVIQPFVFIASIYGAGRLLKKKKAKIVLLVGVYILVATFIFSYLKGPLPFSRERDIHPFLYPQSSSKLVTQWQNILHDERLKISSTGQLAPHFTSRRYFYFFSPQYVLADYVILRTDEIYNYPEKDILIPIYEKLTKDPNFMLVFKQDNLEVYKKI